MNQIIKIMLIAFSLIASVTANSKIVTDKEIKSITELKDVVDPIIKSSPTRKVFIAFDWDNTISKANGCLLPLREGKKTKNTIKELIENKNIYPMVVTASSKAILPLQTIYDFTDELLDSGSAGPFKDFAKNNKISESAIKAWGLGNTIRSLFAKRFADTFNLVKIGKQICNARCELVGCAESGCKLDRGIVTGAKDKGAVLANMLRDKVFAVDGDSVLVFVDNDKRHLESVKKWFMDDRSPFSEIYLIHYPQDPELSSNPKFKDDTSKYTPCAL